MTQLNQGKDLVEYWLNWLGMPRGCVIIQEEEDYVPDYFELYDMEYKNHIYSLLSDKPFLVEVFATDDISYGCVVIEGEDDYVPDFGNFGYWDMKKFAGCIRIDVEW
jgi:hypothetical protein